MKPFWQSKVFWVNVVAIGVMVYNHFFPTVTVSAEAQGYILAGINLVLRLFGSNLTWK